MPYRVWGQEPPKEVTVESFMLKFGTKEEIDERAAKADAERAKYDLEVGKATLMAFFDIDPATGKSRRFQTKLPPGMQGQVQAGGDATAAADPAPAAAVRLPDPGFVPQLTRRKVYGR